MNIFEEALQLDCIRSSSNWIALLSNRIALFACIYACIQAIILCSSTEAAFSGLFMSYDHSIPKISLEFWEAYRQVNYMQPREFSAVRCSINELNGTAFEAIRRRSIILYV